MPKGIAICVGLNEVTSTVFKADPLKACENDAREMFSIAMDRNFDKNLSSLILAKEATFERVVNAVKTAADVLTFGDLFLFSFAGHGTSKVAENSEEEDNHDESIVLADHLLIDNFWQNDLWPSFKPGVRALAIADCCHAETALSSLNASPHAFGALANIGHAANMVSKAAALPIARGGGGDLALEAVRTRAAVRRILDVERDKELEKFSDFYNKQLAADSKPIVVSRIFLSACTDRQDAADGAVHGAFTKALLDIWNNGNFQGDYNDLIEGISEKFINSNQTPSLTALGQPDFTSERPFTI
jgi:hypothetical protein